MTTRKRRTLSPLAQTLGVEKKDHQDGDETIRRIQELSARNGLSGLSGLSGPKDQNDQNDQNDQSVIVRTGKMWLEARS